MALKATTAQIAKLQTLYSQMARREVGVENGREARMQWATDLLGKPVSSFSDLTRSQAIHLIDQAGAALGTEFKAHKLPQTSEQARRAGLDGRRGDEEFRDAPQLVAQQDHDIIRGFVERLGWDEQRFQAFLESERSPLRGRRNRTIITAADANKVRWALKRMLERGGKWEKAA